MRMQTAELSGILRRRRTLPRTLQITAQGRDSHMDSYTLHQHSNCRRTVSPEKCFLLTSLLRACNVD